MKSYIDEVGKLLDAISRCGQGPSMENLKKTIKEQGDEFKELCEAFDTYLKQPSQDLNELIKAVEHDAQAEITLKKIENILNSEQKIQRIATLESVMRNAMKYDREENGELLPCLQDLIDAEIERAASQYEGSELGKQGRTVFALQIIESLAQGKSVTLSEYDIMDNYAQEKLKIAMAKVTQKQFVQEDIFDWQRAIETINEDINLRKLSIDQKNMLMQMDVKQRTLIFAAAMLKKASDMPATWYGRAAAVNAMQYEHIQPRLKEIDKNEKEDPQKKIYMIFGLLAGLCVINTSTLLASACYYSGLEKLGIFWTLISKGEKWTTFQDELFHLTIGILGACCMNLFACYLGANNLNDLLRIYERRAADTEQKDSEAAKRNLHSAKQSNANITPKLTIED